MSHAASAETTAPRGRGTDALDRRLSPGERWTGRALTGFAVVFLLMDATIKVLELAPAMETTVGLGYPAHVVFWLGVLQVVLLGLYLVPRTAVLGAVLWTGYLGGALATHVRVESPLLTHTLFPLFIAALVWGGLWLRDRRLREVLPLRVSAGWSGSDE